MPGMVLGVLGVGGLEEDFMRVRGFRVRFGLGCRVGDLCREV